MLIQAGALQVSKAQKETIFDFIVTNRKETSSVNKFLGGDPEGDSWGMGTVYILPWTFKNMGEKELGVIGFARERGRKWGTRGGAVLG